MNTLLFCTVTTISKRVRKTIHGRLFFWWDIKKVQHDRRQGLFISSQQYIYQGTSGSRESIFLTKPKHQLVQHYIKKDLWSDFEGDSIQVENSPFSNEHTYQIIHNSMTLYLLVFMIFDIFFRPFFKHIEDNLISLWHAFPIDDGRSILVYRPQWTKHEESS